MLELQENIAKALSGTVKLRRQAVERAVREYFDALAPIRHPRAGDFEAAGARAQAVLKEELLAARFINLICAGAEARLRGKDAASVGAEVGESELALVAVSFETIAQPVRIPGPPALTEPKTFTLAVAGAAGAVGGMFGLAALLRVTVDMRDLGLLLGAPLGAWLTVLIVNRLARLRLLARILPWLLVRPRAFRGAVRSEHEKTVRAYLEQWVDWAVPLLTVLCLHRSVAAEAETDRDKALRRIGKLIYTLHRTGPESLPVVAHELIQEAKNSGFEGLEGLPAFLENARVEKETLTWKPDLQTKYETFGHIVAGDQVMVEREAVVLGGRVVQRGLVRKIRERT
jgi:hypothetical protein